MELSRIRALRGPNLWSRHTSIEAVVRCSEDECDIARLPGFEQRLRQRFPELGTLQWRRNQRLVSLAHVLEVATLGLQAQAGCPVTFSRTQRTVDTGVFQVVVEYSEEPVGRLALELADTLVRAAFEDLPFDRVAALAHEKGGARDDDVFEPARRHGGLGLGFGARIKKT